jgi:hypothetical protein
MIIVIVAHVMIVRQIFIRVKYGICILSTIYIACSSYVIKYPRPQCLVDSTSYKSYRWNVNGRLHQ